MAGPSTFDQTVADGLLDLVSDGMSLSKACDTLNVARRTIRTWLATHPDFAAAHKAAMTLRLETLADEVIDIVDDIAGCENAAQVQAARVRAENRRWLLSKVLPATYGDKVELSGAGGRDLIPAENRVPQLMQVLAILMPTASNAELHSLAGKLIGRLNGPVSAKEIAP